MINTHFLFYQINITQQHSVLLYWNGMEIAMPYGMAILSFLELRFLLMDSWESDRTNGSSSSSMGALFLERPQ